MNAHPAADLFPMMDSESRDFRDLTASIKEFGLIEPIVLDRDGRILDGRNRFAACEQAGITPKFTTFADLQLDCDEFDYVWSRNIARRNLLPDVRLAISVELHRLHDEALRAAKVAAGKEGAEARWQGTKSSPAIDEPKTRAKVAEQAGVSEYKAQQAMNVARDAPEVFEQVKAGKVTLKEAAKQTKPRATNATKPKPLDVEREIDRAAIALVKDIRKRAAKIPDRKRKHFIEAVLGQITDELT